MRWSNCFESIGDVWAWWIVSAAAFAYLFCRAARTCSLAGLKGFAGDDRGSAYVLPYVMTFPIYFLLVCIMIQATMIIMVKMGVQYAAYAASRSAIVWTSVEPHKSASARHEKARSMAKRAAVTAIAPFAPGDPKFLQKMFPFASLDFDARLRAELYYDVYRRFDNDNVARDEVSASGYVRRPDQLAAPSYVKNKYRYAEAATEVTMSPRTPVWNENVKLEVRFELPMLLPGAGRILGTWWKTDRYFSRTISSTASLPAETPDSPTGRIGIGYSTERLR